MSRLLAGLRAVGAVLLDPPGWVPAWATTAAVLYLADRAATDPAAIEALRVLADVLKVTLPVWIGYKGLRFVSEKFGRRDPPEDPGKE